MSSSSIPTLTLKAPKSSGTFGPGDLPPENPEFLEALSDFGSLRAWLGHKDCKDLFIAERKKRGSVKNPERFLDFMTELICMCVSANADKIGAFPTSPNSHEGDGFARQVSKLASYAIDGKSFKFTYTSTGFFSGEGWWNASHMWEGGRLPVDTLLDHTRGYLAYRPRDESGAVMRSISTLDKNTTKMGDAIKHQIDELRDTVSSVVAAQDEVNARQKKINHVFAEAHVETAKKVLSNHGYITEMGAIVASNVAGTTDADTSVGFIGQNMASHPKPEFTFLEETLAKLGLPSLTNPNPVAAVPKKKTQKTQKKKKTKAVQPALAAAVQPAPVAVKASSKMCPNCQNPCTKLLCDDCFTNSPKCPTDGCKRKCAWNRKSAGFNPTCSVCFKASKNPGK